MSGGSASTMLEPVAVYGSGPSANPALASELGLPSNALFQAPERAMGYADYKLPGDDLGSRDYRRAYFDKDAKKDENWAPPSPTAPKPHPPELIPDTHEAIAVSTSPDVCRSPSAPVPYPVWGKGDDKQNYSPDVRSNGCVIKRRDSRFTTTYGDEPGTGLGVKSNTVGSKVEPVTSSKIVRANGIPVQRHGDRNDEHGEIAAIIDPAARETRAHHDADGNLELFFDALGYCWRDGYDWERTFVSVVDPLGYRTDITNDAPGRLTGLMGHDGLIEAQTYDAQGRIVTIRDPLGAATTYAYKDGRGLDFWAPTTVTRPDGVTSRRSVDRAGARAVVTDGEGRRVVYRTGPHDLLAEIEDPMGGRLRFSYDGLKRLERVENQLGRVWRFERDGAGNIVAETDFDGLRTAYAYDRSGRLIERTAADGTRALFEWDPSGLLLSETVRTPGDGEPSVTRYGYDQAGRLSEAGNAHAWIEFERDGRGRVVSESINGRRIENTYDCCGNRVSRRLGAAVVASSYDPLGSLTGLSLGGRDPLSLSYDAAGREVHRGSGLGFTLESRHDAVGQLIRQVAGRGAVPGAQPSLALERAYAWNGAFEPVAIADGRWGSAAYRYDANGQVAEGRHGDGIAERFDYDAALNVVAFSDGHAPAEPGVQAASLSGFGSGQAWRQWSSSPGGRVVEARGPQGERVAYVHDALSRVAERRVERDGFRPALWICGSGESMRPRLRARPPAGTPLMRCCNARDGKVASPSLNDTAQDIYS